MNQPPGGQQIRVLVCDDHAVFRRGLSLVLEPEDDIEVVAEASNGEEAVELAREKAPAILADLPATSPLATQGDPS